MPDLTTEELTTALAAVSGVALLSFLIALTALMKLRKARHEYMILRGDAGERDILSAVGRTVKRQDEINKRIDTLAAAQRDQAAIGRFALQRFALVRYDAFDDMGGRLSFSAAFLDDHGDGIVVSSINGRTETRTYAKSVRGLQSEHNLSEEEQAAIRQAAGQKSEGSRTPATSTR